MSFICFFVLRSLLINFLKMKTYQANLLNSLALILMPLWAYFTFEGTIEKPDQSLTAFIPLIFGIILVLCNRGLKKENKIIAHIIVLLTLLLFLSLFMPLKGAIERSDTMAIVRVSIMLFTSFLAQKAFIKSFIDARKS